MNWQPPPPPPRPGGPGPGPGGGQQRPGGPGPGGPGGPNGQQPQQPQQQQPAQKDWKELNYYQLLQVNREAHSTIIRYAYRFLAAMYHPDNSETGDAEKFRIITEAWRTLSDEGKRAAYDMSLGQEESQPGHPRPGGGAPGAQQSAPRAAGYGLPKNFKTGISWQEIELRLAILQILLDMRKKKPKSGGASAKLIMDVLTIEHVEEVEYALWYLREKGLIEPGERAFMITAVGVDYIVDQMNKTNSITESETEKKVKRVVEGGVPAVIPR
ncbi:MAG: J domain-containing protein [Candidatus Melainabacteria bacterium]|nr:J domain-containing protein [Candidatus Melainabacteria bacterium]